jgi:hypothetical protein
MPIGRSMLIPNQLPLFIPTPPPPPPPPPPTTTTTTANMDKMDKRIDWRKGGGKIDHTTIPVLA